MTTITDKGQTFDLGALLIEDSRAAEALTDAKIIERTRENFCALYKQLFELKKTQAEQHVDGEFMEYTKSKYMVELPNSKIALPREKPIPKAKPLTKWEKFRL
jgi:regulator of ribosome biosynthesis